MISRVISLLLDAEVFLFLANGRLCFRARSGAYTSKLRELVGNHRGEIIAWLKAEDLGPMPTDSRARAFWLVTLARRAGYDADALMSFIDDRLGYRSTGPFSLSTNEAKSIAGDLISESGKRPAIESTTPTSADPIDTAFPASITRKIELGWTDARFSSFCQRLLGHPGLRSAEDDRRILAAIEHHAGERRQ